MSPHHAKLQTILKPFVAMTPSKPENTFVWHSSAIFIQFPKTELSKKHTHKYT